MYENEHVNFKNRHCACVASACPRQSIIKVILFSCIAHPFCASFFASLARVRARARSELDRFSMKAELFREINGRFLLNELGDSAFLVHFNI